MAIYFSSDGSVAFTELGCFFVCVFVMAPNSHELHFSEAQVVVRARFPKLEESDIFDHFARSFRDELAPLLRLFYVRLRLSRFRI